jgi:ADP-ribosyl-[dinitrogen reductase] hydrolase
MPNAERIDRARGCMLGLAVGDALGAPLEGLSAQQIRSCYGVVADFVDGVRAWRKKPYRWRLPGLYTDDTQQALVLAECLRTLGRIDLDWLAGTYRALATPRGSYLGAHRGAGASFRKVLECLERDVPPRQVAQFSAGIGAAMRIAPIGLYYRDEPEAIPGAVLEASLLTHRDIRSLAGAAAVACAVRRFARDEPREPSLLFRIADDAKRAVDVMLRLAGDGLAGVRAYRGAVAAAIANVERILDRPRAEAYSALVEEANRHGAEPDCRRPTLGFPPACIPTCLYLLFTTDGPEEALVEIVNLGGDADSAGAILGAFVGACYGEAALPGRWLDRLRNRDGIARRAEFLATRECPADMPDLFTTEWRLTAEECAARAVWMARPFSGGDLGANRRR